MALHSRPRLRGVVKFSAPFALLTGLACSSEDGIPDDGSAGHAGSPIIPSAGNANGGSNATGGTGIAGPTAGQPTTSGGVSATGGGSTAGSGGSFVPGGSGGGPAVPPLDCGAE